MLSVLWKEITLKAVQPKMYRTHVAFHQALICICCYYISLSSVAIFLLSKLTKIRDTVPSNIFIFVF